MTDVPLSSDWGISRTRDGKCVWAFLSASAGAAYSQTVRAAVRDATRTALAYGLETPDAATAVRHLIIRLVAQHRHDFVRDVAQELANEPAALNAVTAGQDAPGWPRLDPP